MFQVCRGCGCSNFAACEGGCWWVEDDLCSTCNVAPFLEQLAAAAEPASPGPVLLPYAAGHSNLTAAIELRRNGHGR
jgi:hypothetical protein